MPDFVGFLVRLLAPDASPDAYNDWRLVSGSSVSDATMWVLGALVAVSLIATHSGLRRAAPSRRRLLLALRVAAAVVVFGLFLMPAVELRAVSKVRSRVVLLLDDSRSMGLATPSGTRAERVVEHLESHASELLRLSKEAVLEVATFGERMSPIEGVPSALEAQSARTDLGRALAELSWQSSGRDLGAVILYSDGSDTEGLTPDRAWAQAEQLGAPIYTVGFPPKSSSPDLAVTRIVADDFAFVHNTVSLDVELEQRGLPLSMVVVTLKREGRLVASKEARFDHQGRARVSFEFKPNQIGKQAYSVSVPVQSSEVVASNNQRSVVLKVIRDRIRILQVAGRPSWDERFLRELLKRNPNVDLISFFILRSTTDLQRAPQEELALIPFPVDDLFTSELETFDIVIYQNFTYLPYRMSRYLSNIRDYVLKGGSFLMVGGDNAFEDGHYAGTPLSTVLPVRLGGAMAWDPGEYRPRLTDEGRRHPITRIGEPGEPPEAVYGRLPALAGVNSSLGLAPDAQALLSHPGLPGNPPVVSIREVGEGRSMAVATDSLWFWRFVAAGEGRAGREFDRFWNGALRWLIRDPELARVRVRAERSVLSKGEPVSAEVRVLGADYRGLGKATVDAELVRLDEGQPVVQELQATTGPEGNAVLAFGEIEPGTYNIRVRAATADGEMVGRAVEPVIVEAADVELLTPFPNPQLLEALSEASGGRFTPIDEDLPEIEIEDTRRVEIDRTRRVPVWDRASSVLLLLILLGAEWWLRRRSGLI